MSVRETALEFLGRGGKKLRPRLCKTVFDALVAKGGGVAPEGNLAAVLDALECFHKASLVHDDIQDGDEERYGRPTVWKERGVAVAIAVGDWLVAHGYGLIAKSGFANAGAMMEATLDSHLRLCEGQGDELLAAGEGRALSAAERALNYERKTGEAFALAAALGALAAGADPAPYRAFALAYGVVFQIRDDRADGDGALAAELAVREREARNLLAALPAGANEISELLKI